MTPETQPGRPGWYWDPQELDHNLALRARWRQELILREPSCYRLRMWDGSQWTDETLERYTLQGMASVPHLIGPATRVHPLTPEASTRNLKIWAALMAMAGLGWAVALVLR